MFKLLEQLAALVKAPCSSQDKPTPRMHERVGEHAALATGERPDRLPLGYWQQRKNLAGARFTPATLTHQQFGYRHAMSLPRTLKDDVCYVDVSAGHTPLQLCASEPNLICTVEGPHVLRTDKRGRRYYVHARNLQGTQHPCFGFGESEKSPSLCNQPAYRSRLTRRISG